MIINLINETTFAKEQAKRVTQESAGITNWRSSGLGSCMRGRFLARILSGTGIKPEIDPRTLRVFEIGNQVETWLMDNLKNHPDYTVYQQVEVEDPARNIKGHIDALIYDKKNGKWFVVECKSRHSKSFWYMDKKGEGASVHHKMQLHSYIAMLNTYGGKITFSDGIIQEFTPFNGAIQDGYIVYVSKDDMAMLEYKVSYNDTNLLAAWTYELNTLNSCWKLKKAPPAPEKGSWQEKYCEYCLAGLCASLTDETVKELFDVVSEQKKHAPLFNIGDSVYLKKDSPFKPTFNFPVRGSGFESVGVITGAGKYGVNTFNVKWQNSGLTLTDISQDYLEK